MNVQTIAQTLAQRTHHTLLCKVLDGSATKDDLTQLRETATHQIQITTGTVRADWLATKRLASSLTTARFDGQWRHVSPTDLRAAQTFAFGSVDSGRKYERVAKSV